MAAKYTRLGQRETAAREWEVPAVSAFAVLYAAATLSVWLAVPVWTVQGKTTGLLDDWTQPPEGTATEPEPGTKALLWAALGFDLAAAAAAGLSVVPGLPTLIGRFGNRQAAAALAWVALVLTATAADAIGKPSSQAPLESTPPALTSNALVHHVASNVGSATGGVAPIGLALSVGILGFLATVEFWEHLGDE